MNFPKTNNAIEWTEAFLNDLNLRRFGQGKESRILEWFAAALQEGYSQGRASKEYGLVPTNNELSRSKRDWTNVRFVPGLAELDIAMETFLKNYNDPYYDQKAELNRLTGEVHKIAIQAALDRIASLGKTITFDFVKGINEDQQSDKMQEIITEYGPKTNFPIKLDIPKNILEQNSYYLTPEEIKSSKKCTCDLMSVIMVTGCKCGEMKREKNQEN